MSITTIGEKFVHDLTEIYDAELQFFDAQQTMLERASSPQLQALLTEHRNQTRIQIENLEQIFDIMGSSPFRGSNAAAQGLVKAGEAAMDAAQANSSYSDCVIASAVGQVEHYEVACYRNLIATAERFQRGDLSAILGQNLHMEQQAAETIEEFYRSLLADALTMQRLQSMPSVTQPLYQQS